MVFSSRSTGHANRCRSRMSSTRSRAWHGLQETRPREIGRYQVFQIDAFDWLQSTPPKSIHAVVTDPPYGVLEYTPRELAKLRKRKGGVWRIPPAFDGC